MSRVRSTYSSRMNGQRRPVTELRQPGFRLLAFCETAISFDGCPPSSRRPEAELAMTGGLPIGFVSARRRAAPTTPCRRHGQQCFLWREVEGNMSRDNDFSLCSKLHQTRQLVLGQFPAPGSLLGFIEPLS